MILAVTDVDAVRQHANFAAILLNAARAIAAAITQIVRHFQPAAGDIQPSVLTDSQRARLLPHRIDKRRCVIDAYVIHPRRLPAICPPLPIRIPPNAGKLERPRRL